MRNVCIILSFLMYADSINYQNVVMQDLGHVHTYDTFGKQQKVCKKNNTMRQQYYTFTIQKWH